MLCKKKIEPITRDQLIEMLEFVYEDSNGQIYNSFMEDTNLTNFIDSAVKQINDHFNPPTQA